MFASVFILQVCLSYYMPFSSGTSGRLSTSCKKSAPSQIDGQELVSVLGNQTRWKLRMAVADIFWPGRSWDDEIGKWNEHGQVQLTVLARRQCGTQLSHDDTFMRASAHGQPSKSTDD